MRWFVFLAFGVMVAAGTSAAAASRCDRLLGLLGHQIADASCADSTDLTTNNLATTPANDLLPGLAPFAFTPQTDRNVISPNPPNRTPITEAVPGIQLDARISDDPIDEPTPEVAVRVPKVAPMAASVSPPRARMPPCTRWSLKVEMTLGVTVFIDGGGKTAVRVVKVDGVAVCVGIKVMAEGVANVGSGLRNLPLGDRRSSLPSR